MQLRQLSSIYCALGTDILKLIRDYSSINSLLNTTKLFIAEKKLLYIWKLSSNYSLQYMHDITFKDKLTTLIDGPCEQLYLKLDELESESINSASYSIS